MEGKRVLFVCTGNTCRSPMAEGIYNKMSVGALSRGLMVYGAPPASENAVKAMAEMGIDISNHTARQIAKGDIEESGVVLTMTLGHKRIILAKWPEFEGKVFTLGEMAGGDDVPDPYGGDIDEYRRCAETIKNYVVKAIEKINGND